MNNALLLLSWKVSLGLATAEMLVDAATNSLVAGSQSKAFAQLAGENPRTAHFHDLLQYFITGLKDEGITRPTKEESSLRLLIHTLDCMKNGTLDPISGMAFIDNELKQIVLFPDAENFVGAKLGLEHCYTWYREYSDYLDGSDIWYYTSLPRDEAALKFKEHIVDEASKALKRIQSVDLSIGV